MTAVRRGRSRMFRMGLALMPLTLACSGVFGPGNGEFEENLVKWRESGIDDYQFRFQRLCFCALSVESMIVEVRDGAIVSVVDADSGEPIESGHGDFYLTVDGIFAAIRDALDRDAHELTAIYHETLGYPIEVDIDYEENAVDEEVSFRAGALVELN